MQNKQLLILDGTSLINGAYNATLTSEMEDARKMFDSAKTEEEKEIALKAKEEAYKTLLKSTSGNYINAVQEFFKELLDLLDRQNPSHVVVCWGTPRNTNYKREIFDGYKNDGKKMDEPLKEQFTTIQTILNNIGIAQYRSEKYEALDIAGSIANKFKNTVPTCIVARNQNSLQLCDNSTVWLKTNNRDMLSEQYDIDLSHVSECFMEYNKSRVEKIYDLNIDEFIDYRAMIGSSSSGIPGIKGVGEKTAFSLIKYFGSIDNMYSELNNIKKKDLENPNDEILKNYTKYLKDKLGVRRLSLSDILKDEENAKISQKLVLMKRDILLEEKPLDIKIDKLILMREMRKCNLANLEMTDSQIPSANFSELIITFNPTILSPSSEDYIGEVLTDSYIIAINKGEEYVPNGAVYEVAYCGGCSGCEDDEDNDYEDDKYCDTHIKNENTLLSKETITVDLETKNNSSFELIKIVTSFKYKCNHCNEYFVTEGKTANFCPHCGVRNDNSNTNIPIIEKSKCSLTDMKY